MMPCSLTSSKVKVRLVQSVVSLPQSSAGLLNLQPKNFPPLHTIAL